MRVAWGPLGFLSRRCRGLRPYVQSGPEADDSSPVLTWILGCFWSLPRGVSPRLSGRMHVRLPPELWQQCHASLRLDQGICGFPLRLSHEAFKGGFPTGLSQVPPWCESILGLKSRQCRENRFPWNGLRHLGDSGQGSRLSSYKAETGLLWMWAGRSCFLSIGDGYVGEVLELQQWCEGPFGSSRV